MAYIGSSPTKVVSRQSANIFTYTATANQTAFTGTDANGNTLACTPSDLMVHMNGLRLEESDFTATTTTVTLGSGAAAGDEVTITAFVTFETADAYTKSASDTRYVNTTGGNITGDFTVDTDTLKVDSTNDRVLINTTTEGRHSEGADILTIAAPDNQDSGITVRSGTSSYGSLYFSDATSGVGEYAGSMQFNHSTNQLALGVAGSDYLKINSSGPVTMPNQPSMAGRAIRPNPTGGYATTGVNLYLNDLDHNIGNHWNNSTGVWTCPVAGKYYCYAAFLIDNDQGSGSLARYTFKKNGSEFFIAYHHDKYGSNYGGTATTGGIYNCAANDTITCVATHGKFHSGAESAFSICLLG